MVEELDLILSISMRGAEPNVVDWGCML